MTDSGPLSLLFAAILASPGIARSGDPPSYNRDVRPILSDRCYHCHGPDATNQDSAFRLDTRENATADLGGYVGIAAGDVANSELHARIHATDWARMPPADSNRSLTDAERDVLDRWIAAGAPFDPHPFFTPLPAAVPVPAENGDWVTSPIDRFVAAGHAAHGLTPAPPAPPAKWLRRVTFDLTGLPPTLAELDAFLADPLLRRDRVGAEARVVDRLLASDACAERLTAEWLDVARYGDTYGYQRDDARFVWPWRDWVLRAFRTNMPFDRFLTEQLAGDLLPDATGDQRLATAFNRLHSHKKEGGVAVEEFRVENVADRTHTAAAAFLGLTVECARCHDHKYDPVTQRDYYALSAFFANVEENGLISYFTDAVPTPAMPLPDAAQDAEIHAAAAAVEDLERRLVKVRADGADDFAAWLADENRPAAPGPVASLSFDAFVDPPAGVKDETGKPRDPAETHAFANDGGPAAVTTSANKLADGRAGRSVEFAGDDAVVLPGAGHFARYEPFSFALWIRPAEVTERGVIVRRSRGWDDAGSIGYELTKEPDRLVAKLVHFWPGDAIAVETTEPLVAGEWAHVAVTYDGSSRAAGLRIFVNGEPAETRVLADHLTRTITDWRGGYPDLALGARYRDRGFVGGRADEFRLFDRAVAPVEVTQLFDGHALDDLLAADPADPSDDDRATLSAYFFAAVHGPTRTARADLTAARGRLAAAVDATPAITVMRETAEPRPAFLLERGMYDQPGEPVTADTPAFLPPFPDDAPRNRLGLARWLTDPDHPLTARVAVNRYWQLLFGRGLVDTPEDFGNQGSPPSHPELLDWLARDFVAHGWDVRRLLRSMALSATYRQDSVVSPAVRERDPENRWLARAHGARLSAEMVRDNALAVSGLLAERFGGPPVKPYDLALAYTPLPADSGDGLYRRSLYTFWKRTAPAPVMLAMNAGRRDVCRLRRDVVQSPLQALVLLNGPQFVEASRVLAGTLLDEHGGNVDAAAADAFRRLTARPPTAAEAKILADLYAEQLAQFEANPGDAAALLAVGAAPVRDDLPPARHAALTVLVNALLNLDECVRRP